MGPCAAHRRIQGNSGARVSVINPHTGETFDKDKLLSLLMEWTTEGRLLHAMIGRDRADFVGLLGLVAMVKATADQKAVVTPSDIDTTGQIADPVPVVPLTERQIAAALMAFLVDPVVRKLVAMYVSSAYRLPMKQAKEDLYELREYLKRTFQLTQADIPSLRLSPFGPAGTQEAADNAQEWVTRKFDNPALAWDPARPPAWIEEYKATREALSEHGELWIRGMTSEKQGMARAFPPMSLVVGLHPGMICPRQDMLAFVKGYAISEEGLPVLRVSAYEAGGDSMEVRPEDVELVACCGQITREAVEAACTREAVAQEVAS